METLQISHPVESQLYIPEFNQDRPSLPALLDELSALVGQLGARGGSLSPSIYDTAQVLRLAPPKEGVKPGLDWLLENQGADGGWGNPIAPYMRDVPTLSAVLALHQYNHSGIYDQAIRCGLRFLRKQSNQWLEFSADDLLVGVELILPRLVEEAIQKNLDLPYQPYQKLNKIGNQKRKMIQHLKVVHGTPAAFSWEAWGEFPDRYLLDALHSIGNSTSATAAWIAKAREAQITFNLSLSMAYLELASHATGLNIPGVVPFAWPIDRFEQSFALYAVAISGLFTHSAIKEVLKPQIAHLFSAFTPYGLSFSDYFIPDLDDTAASIVVFRTYGLEVHPEILNIFKDGRGYFTYPGEFHASISAHARAVHALSYMNQAEAQQAQQVLLPFQSADGAWPGDKWHKSWLYTTSHMLYTLHHTPELEEVEKGLNKLLDSQKADGGWGIGTVSTTAETAYVMLALNYYKAQRPNLAYAYQRGQAWLMQNIFATHTPEERLWIGKELFKPYRIDRAFELSALIQAMLS